MPSERRYSPEHTWIEQRDGQLWLGLTAYALERFGTLRQLEISARVDNCLQVGDVVGSLESNESLVDLHTPLAGKVVAIHDEVLRDPARLVEDCYDDGWLLRLEPEDPTDFAGLLDAVAYSELLRARGSHL